MRARTWIVGCIASATFTTSRALAQGELEARGATTDASKATASLGMDLRRFQDDFGIGATASTPMLGSWLRLTLGGGIAWYPHGVAQNGNQTWEMFEHGRLVVEIGPTFQRGVPVRPYGFAGTSVLFLPSRLSSDSVAIGGVGGFGVELAFMSGVATGPVTYYMEIGGAGFSASANRLPSSPDLASGLLLGAGFRVYL